MLAFFLQMSHLYGPSYCGWYILPFDNAARVDTAHFLQLACHCNAVGIVCTYWHNSDNAASSTNVEATVRLVGLVGKLLCSGAILTFALRLVCARPFTVPLVPYT